jgi:GNAT superfamily N-acetyltransferase
MTDTNNIWQPREVTEAEYTFEGWFNWENKFGEFGTPGYNDFTEDMKIPNVFGDDIPRQVSFTLYRQDSDGLLLAVVLRYYTDEGVRKPLLMLVHPDHRGKGIATQVILRNEEKFINEEAHVYGYTVEEFRALPRAERAALTVPQVLDVPVNEAGAGLSAHISNIFHTVEKDFTQGE